MGVLSFLPSGTYLSASIRPKKCPSGQENETSEIIKIKVVWGAIYPERNVDMSIIDYLES
jgi:hypothetical protein